MTQCVTSKTPIMTYSDNIKKTSMKVDNLIVVEGGAYKNVKKALRQWMKSYANDLPDDCSFMLSTNENGIHFIQADKRLGNDLFYFLVNDLDCQKGMVNVKGFTIGKKNGILKGKRLLIYISPTDKEGDNVFAVTSDNENFKISFGGKIKKTEGGTTFEPLMELRFDNPEIVKRDKQQEERKKNQKTLVSVDKRFKIFFVISGILFASTLFILFALGDKELFQKSTVFLGGGIWFWFFMDYVMLRYNKYYLRCLGIAILYAIYAVFLGNYYKNDAINIIALNALIFLLMQKLLRKIYLVLLKKEPKIDGYGTFEDLIYSIFLSIGTILLSISIMTRIR